MRTILTLGTPGYLLTGGFGTLSGRKSARKWSAGNAAHELMPWFAAVTPAPANAVDIPTRPQRARSSAERGP
jgi:hypothetical protein